MDRSDEPRIRIPGDLTLVELVKHAPISLVRIFIGLVVGLVVVAFSVGHFVGARFPISSSLWFDSSSSEATTSLPNIEANEPSLTAIRGQDGVTLIDNLQNGQTSDRISIGQYGYVYGGDVEGYVVERRSMVLRTEWNPLRFELHKVSNQRFLLVGYVSAIDDAALKDPTGSRSEFELFSVPQAGMRPVAIDIETITSWQDRDLPANAGKIVEVHLKQK
jgi:hypothetical protein